MIAFLNAADGSIATTSMRARQAGLRVGQPAADRGGVTAVHDAEDLAAVGVHDGRHPRLHPPPATVLVTEPAHPAVAVLIDPEPAHPQVVHVGQQQRCGVRPWPARSTTPHRGRLATSATARPESITAARTAVFSRVVHRARAAAAQTPE